MKPEEQININNSIDDDEIDLTQLFSELKKHWRMLLAALLLGGIIVGAVSKFLITPQYESTAMMFILTKETTLTSLADLQIGSQLTNDYKVVVTSRTVLQNTIDDLGLADKYTYKDLRNSKITINNPQNTRILEIVAKDPDPKLAKMIADTVAENAADYIADTMEIAPPKIIETGEVPEQKASPKNGRNAAIGALVGFLIAAAIIVVQTLLNDSVTTADDVEKYLGLTVLASLPDRSEEKKAKGKKKTAKK